MSPLYETGEIESVMKAIIQRVSQASVTVDGTVISAINRGYLILLGVGQGDEVSDSQKLADKIAYLRLFPNAEGKFDLSVIDVNGEIVVVSQFTLLADCHKGRRPSFHLAAPPETAERLYLDFVGRLSNHGIKTVTGKFQASMQVALVNDGPVTITLDSQNL